MLVDTQRDGRAHGGRPESGPQRGPWRPWSPDGPAPREGGAVAAAARYLRNFEVVLSASTLPPVWHVAQ